MGSVSWRLNECRLTFFPRNNGEKMPLHRGFLRGHVVNPKAVTRALAAAASQLLLRAGRRPGHWGPSWGQGAPEVQTQTESGSWS